MNKVVLLGSTGMIGSEVLKLCLSDSNIHKVVSISRNKTGIEHEKLKEIIHSDFLDFSNLSDELRDVSSLFFCIGVYTGAVDKEKFKVITYDFTVAISKAILEQSPNVNFMFLSGA